MAGTAERPRGYERGGDADLYQKFGRFFLDHIENNGVYASSGSGAWQLLGGIMPSRHAELPDVRVVCGKREGLYRVSLYNPHVDNLPPSTAEHAYHISFDGVHADRTDFVPHPDAPTVPMHLPLSPIFGDILEGITPPDKALASHWAWSYSPLVIEEPRHFMPFVRRDNQNRMFGAA